MSHFFSGNHDMGGQFLYNYKEEEKVMVKQKLVWIPVFNWTAFYVFNIYVQGPLLLDGSISGHNALAILLLWYK